MCGRPSELSPAFSPSRNCLVLGLRRWPLRRKITAAEWLSAQVLYVREADLRPGAHHFTCDSPFGAKLFSKVCYLVSGIKGPSPAVTREGW